MVANRVDVCSLRCWCGSQDLVHGLAGGKFVDDLVEVADLLHEWLLDVLDAYTAYRTRDQARVLVECSLAEEVSKRCLLIEVTLQGGWVEPGEPYDDLVEFVFRPALFLLWGPKTVSWLVMRRFDTR